MTKQQHGYLDREAAARAGSLAMLFYSIAAVTAGRSGDRSGSIYRSYNVDS